MSNASARDSGRLRGLTRREPQALAHVGVLSAIMCQGLSQGTHCGYPIVPDDYAHLAGRTLRLAEPIIKSTAEHPRPDPVVFLAGGPGDPAIGGVDSANLSLSPDRDLILIDQRSAGFSGPDTACAQVTGQQGAQYDAAVRTCHAQLVHAGIDLDALNSLTMAADIAALGPALGYKSIDLYAVFYGTRIALTVLRLYPTVVRSVVLDSPFPLQSNLFALQFTSSAPRSTAGAAAAQVDAPLTTTAL